MTKYKLFSEYAKKDDSVIESKKPKSKYQEYVMEVDGKESVVYIPLRECDNFEDIINQTTYITEEIIKDLMRQFRGIRNRDT